MSHPFSRHNFVADGDPDGLRVVAHGFDEIGNSEVQPYRAEHPRQLGVRLKQFVEAGWLQRNGHGRGTRYRWPSRVSGDLFGAGNGRAPDSEHSTARSEQIEPGSEHLGSEQLERLKTLAAPMDDKAKVSKGLAEHTILAGADGWLSLRTMAQLLARDPDSLRNHYINPMLCDGRLLARVPGKPNHPGQAYKASAR